MGSDGSSGGIGCGGSGGGGGSIGSGGGGSRVDGERYEDSIRVDDRGR